METFLGKYIEEYPGEISKGTPAHISGGIFVRLIECKSLEKLLPHFMEDEVLIYIPAGIFNEILSIIPEQISGGLLDEIPV